MTMSTKRTAPESGRMPKATDARRPVVAHSSPTLDQFLRGEQERLGHDAIEFLRDAIYAVEHGEDAADIIRCIHHAALRMSEAQGVYGVARRAAPQSSGPGEDVIGRRSRVEPVDRQHQAR